MKHKTKQEINGVIQHLNRREQEAYLFWDVHCRHLLDAKNLHLQKASCIDEPTTTTNFQVSHFEVAIKTSSIVNFALRGK